MLSFVITFLSLSVAAFQTKTLESEIEPLVLDVNNIDNKFFVVDAYIGENQ